MTTLREVLGSVGVWGHLDSLPAAELRTYVGRVADLGYGALWVPETVGREPFTLLGSIAEAAGPMWLGSSIVSVWGHDAMTARMAAMTLHELTGGRFVLGLGVSHPHLAQKLRGHEYARPLSTMREFLEAYRRLPYRGPRLPAPLNLTCPGADEIPRLDNPNDVFPFHFLVVISGNAQSD